MFLFFTSHNRNKQRAPPPIHMYHHQKSSHTREVSSGRQMRACTCVFNAARDMSESKVGVCQRGTVAGQSCALNSINIAHVFGSIKCCVVSVSPCRRLHCQDSVQLWNNCTTRLYCHSSEALRGSKNSSSYPNGSNQSVKNGQQVSKLDLFESSTCCFHFAAS